MRDINSPILDDKLIVQYDPVGNPYLYPNLQDGPYNLSISVERLLRFRTEGSVPIIESLEISISLLPFH